MGIFEKLPNKEELEDYISTYAGYESTHSRKDRATLAHLMRFWEGNKGMLYKLLGEQFIVEKEIELNKPFDKIKSDINESMYCGAMRTFADNFQVWVEKRYDESEKTEEDFREMLVLNDLVGAKYLAKGSLTTSRQVKVKINDDTIIPIQNGVKPTRILSKISRIANIPDFEDFRLELSRILNDKTLRGTMCLSIHPLDYITMSDNPYGWDSCMNWMNEGQYRMGTVEMMNSSNVIVAYLKGDKTLRFYDNEWNGKKWRNLFIVQDNFMTGIKGYPYQNEEFDIKILEWLKELAKKNLGWEFGEPIEYTPESNEGNFYDHDGNTIYFNFETNIMYNDFGNNNVTHIVLAPGEERDGNLLECIYSGPTECMYCGKHLSSTAGDLYDLDSEGCVICNDCLVSYTCDGCGDRVPSENHLYELDGMYYCENCYNDNAVEDVFTGETHHVENCKRFYLLDRIPEEGLSLALWKVREVYCYDDCDEYVENIHSYEIKNRWWNETIYFITPNDLTEAGWKVFDESDFCSVDSCIESD